MSLKELESTIAQLPRSEKAELLRILARQLRAPLPVEPDAKPSTMAPVERTQWLHKLERLRSLTASAALPPSQKILDELREDRI